jgi:hypothetical protein
MTKKLDHHIVAGGMAHWKNEHGDIFEDIEIEFGREISIREKSEVLKDFVLGFEKLEATDEYAVVALDFVESHIFKLTVQILSIGKSRAVLALLVGLREKFPVIRIGNRTYP